MSVSPEVLADAELMRRVGAGEARAFRQISEQHLQQLVNFAFRLLQDRGEAEEVTQEAFIRLWRAAPRWRPEARVGTWLYRVTHNLAVDRLRKRRSKAELDEDVAVDSNVPSRALGRKQVALAVRAAMDALPERQRQAVVLSQFESLSNPQIGEIMEISVEAVESLLSRARRALKIALSGCVGEEK